MASDSKDVDSVSEEKDNLPAVPTSTASANEHSNTTKIDRGKSCPFLLRTFCRHGVHHRLDEFSPRLLPVKHEIQIYTWKDATMRELASLIQGASANAAEPNLKMSFQLVFRNNNGPFISRDLGIIVPGRANDRDAEKTLSDVRFEIGDYLDVALFSGSEQRPSIQGMPAPRSGRAPFGGFGRGDAGGFSEPWNNGKGGEGWGNGGRQGPWDRSDNRGANIGPRRFGGERHGTGADWGRERREWDSGGRGGGGAAPDRRPERRDARRFEPYSRGR